MYSLQSLAMSVLSAMTVIWFVPDILLVVWMRGVSADDT